MTASDPTRRPHTGHGASGAGWVIQLLCVLMLAGASAEAASPSAHAAVRAPAILRAPTMRPYAANTPINTSVVNGSTMRARAAGPTIDGAALRPRYAPALINGAQVRRRRQ